MTTIMGVADKESGMLLSREVTISADEGIRADTTIEAVSMTLLQGTLPATVPSFALTFNAGTGQFAVPVPALPASAGPAGHSPPACSAGCSTCFRVLPADP